jgi:hypothetical protein
MINKIIIDQKPAADKFPSVPQQGNKKVLSKSQILNKEPLNKTKAKKARKKI